MWGFHLRERDEVGDRVFVGLKVQSRCLKLSSPPLLFLCLFYGVCGTAVEMLSSTKLISITFNVKIHTRVRPPCNYLKPKYGIIELPSINTSSPKNTRIIYSTHKNWKV